MSPLPDQPDRCSEDQPISLEELSNAFAEAMRGPSPSANRTAADTPHSAGSGTEGEAAEADSDDSQSADHGGPIDEPTGESIAGTTADSPAAQGDETVNASGMAAASEDQNELLEDQESPEAENDCPLTPQSIIEALLFVGNQGSTPLPPKALAELMRGVEPDEVPSLVGQLNQKYLESGCPYHIVSEGDGYRMVLHQRFEPVRARFYGRVREARLSQAAIDVLAIIAYQQPLTSDEVGRLRGRPSGHILSQLVHRRLLEIRRDKQKPRTAYYHTTDRFLALFNLESLDDLPQAEDMSS